MFDDDRDRDDELFRVALQRVAGPEPDAYSSLEAFAGVRRVLPRRSRATGPRLAVLAAAAAVLLLLAAVNRRAASGIHPAATTATVASSPVTTAAKGMSSIIVTAPTTASTSAPTPPSTVATAAVTTEILTETSDGSTPSDRAVDAAGGDAGAGEGGSGGIRGNGSGRGPNPSTARTPTSAGGAVTTTPLAPATTAPPAPAPTAAPTPRRFAVTGGRVTVTVQNGAFGRPTVVTDAGWEADVRRADATRIEIRFKNDGNDITARLTLLASGDVQVDEGNGG